MLEYKLYKKNNISTAKVSFKKNPYTNFTSDQAVEIHVRLSRDGPGRVGGGGDGGEVEEVVLP